MERKHTPLPWLWEKRSDGDISLIHPGHGHLIVMDFVRRGMQRAEPRFAVWKGVERGRMGGLMVRASELDLESHPDAAFLCHAANNHYSLLEACKKLLFANQLFSEPDFIHDPDTEWEKAMDLAEKAIADAEKE